MKEIIMYFKDGKETKNPDEATEVIVQEIDEEGKLIKESMYNKE